MLQSRSRYGKLQRFALGLHRQQTMNDTAGERIATSHTVDDGVYVVTFGHVELLAVVYHGFPSVVSGRDGFTQSGNDILEAERIHHAFEDAFVAFGLRAASFYVRIRLETQTKFCVFFIADAYVYVLHQGLHDALGFLGSPKFLAEIEVAGNGYTVLFGCNTCLAQAFGTGV